MRIPNRWLAVMVVGLLCGTAVAEEPKAKGEMAKLLAKAATSPMPFDRVVRTMQGVERWPLKAELLIDTEGRLNARGRVAIVRKDKTTYEEWTGPIHVAGWMAVRRELTADADVAACKTLLAQLGERRHAVWGAIAGAVRNAENPGRPADLVIAAEPIASEDGVRVAIRAVDDGAMQRIEYKAFKPRYMEATADAGEAPARIEPTARTLPGLDVPDGVWFNVEEELTLASLRGKPLLIVATDPG